MKKTVDVNIGGMAFVIDEDAYDTLGAYLADVESRIDESDPAEIMGDIESRIAEIFSERITSRNQVVGMDLVRHAMAIIGQACAFGEQRYDPANNNRTDGRSRVRELFRQKLYRSRSDKILAGICGGLADYFEVDATLVRILVFVSFIVSFSVTFWVYLVLWVIVPREPAGFRRCRNDKHPRT